MSIVPRFSSELSNARSDSSFPRDLWEPFDRCPFIRDLFATPFAGYGTSSLLSTSAAETPEAHVLKAYVPGVKKEDVRVEVEDGVVTVTVPKKEVEKPPVRRTIEITGL